MSGARVLVVDDEPDYLSLMKAHLTRRGYQVEGAANGVEALSLVRDGPPFDVMVADLMMPEMDGLELLRRAQEHDPDLQVVVISGVGTLESAISSMRMGGAYDYLPKPLDSIRDLSLAVERAAEHRRLRQERERLQQQVAAERQRLQAVIENTKDALVSTDVQGVIAVSNPAADELFGGHALAGQVAVEVLPPALSTLVRHWLVMKPRRATVTEVGWPHSHVHMVSLTPTSQDGKGAGWVMLLRDVTKARRLQQMKMGLLAQAADSLRQPLTDALAALLTLNEHELGGGEPVTGAIQRAMADLGEIRSWTDEMLAIVEIEADLAEQGDQVSLQGLTERQAGLPADDLIADKGLELQVKADSPLDVQVDSALGAKLLRHLINQAAWRAEPGSRIRMDLESEDDECWLMVRDEAAPLVRGGGPELFEAVMSEAADGWQGIGLSLAMIKATADALGAQLWVASGKKRGNTFTVVFPATAGRGKNGQAG